MIEIRQDLISKRKVIINENRAVRPRTHQEYEVKKEGKCVFCPGFEHKTPPELARKGKGKNWTIRVFANKYPVLTLTHKYKSLRNGSAKRWKGHGNNEVIVLTPDNYETPFEFTRNKWFEVLKVYQERLEYNLQPQEIKYILLLHNQGFKSGASIYHSHSQLVSFPFIPAYIKEEAKSCAAGLCCRMINEEADSERFVWKNKDFIIFTNFASRFPFEAHIYPFKHTASLTDLNDNELQGLSEAVKTLMTVYKKEFKTLDYNFVIHNAPKGKDYHFHIEFYPHFARFAGIEYGTGVNVNLVSPEAAAAALRGWLK